MLDIIITHYNEPFEIGEKLFQMINLQRCIDFDAIRVIVVHDGSESFPDEYFSKYKYKVDQICIPHGGVSAARNAGIENATGQWLMFCDFDDTFVNIYALRDYFNVLPTDDFDMIWSKTLHEDYINGHEVLAFMLEGQNYLFTHGKAYRRQFLIDKNIRFDTELTFNEDGHFNAIIIARTPYQRIGELKTRNVTYGWMRRTGSVTTNHDREDEANYCQFRRNLKVTAEYDENDDRYNGMVTRTVYDAFYMIHGNKISKGMKERIQTELAPWIAERFEHFGKVNDDILPQIIGISRFEQLEGLEIPDSLDVVSRWINKITGKGEE